MGVPVIGKMVSPLIQKIKPQEWDRAELLRHVALLAANYSDNPTVATQREQLLTVTMLAHSEHITSCTDDILGRLAMEKEEYERRRYKPIVMFGRELGPFMEPLVVCVATVVFFILFVVVVMMLISLKHRFFG